MGYSPCQERMVIEVVLLISLGGHAGMAHDVVGILRYYR